MKCKVVDYTLTDYFWHLDRTKNEDGTLRIIFDEDMIVNRDGKFFKDLREIKNYFKFKPITKYMLAEAECRVNALIDRNYSNGFLMRKPSVDFNLLPASSILHAEPLFDEYT